MLTLTADVNGWTIGKVFVHNTGEASGGLWLYDAAYYNEDTGDMVLGIEGLFHKRNLGWGPLAMIVLHKVNEANLMR